MKIKNLLASVLVVFGMNCEVLAFTCENEDLTNQLGKMSSNNGCTDYVAENVDMKTFDILNNIYAKDKNNVYAITFERWETPVL